VPQRLEAGYENVRLVAAVNCCATQKAEATLTFSANHKAAPFSFLFRHIPHNSENCWTGKAPSPHKQCRPALFVEPLCRIWISPWEEQDEGVDSERRAQWKIGEREESSNERDCAA
jgi:hypothetical protein